MSAGVWALVSQLRAGAHHEGALVSMGKMQLVFAQLERDVRDGLPRGNTPFLLGDEERKAIDFPGSAEALASLEKPIQQVVTTYPAAEDRAHSGTHLKKWTLTAKGWIHTDWPEFFKSADDDLEAFGEPDLERVAARYSRAYEESFATIEWPTRGKPKRVFFAVWKGAWVVYTWYVEATETRPAGSVWRYEQLQPPARELVRGGIALLDAAPSLEFAAYPGDRDRAMELVKTAVWVRVKASEVPDANPIAAAALAIDRRVYPPALQSIPYRERWSGD